MPIAPHVLGQGVYALRKEGDLNLRGAGVPVMKAKTLYYCLLLLFLHYRKSIIAQAKRHVNHL